ncbi:MAG: nuclear transport factor 2 family protein [Deltaproteobacteria bacterium]|nr:nuclear transport factor 2 family protein [Deltaproteobacteria bacterium]
MNRDLLVFSAVLILAISLVVSGNAFLEAKKAENAPIDENLELQRALAYGEIQNVMAAHTYCYEAQKQAYEIENFWSKRDDISYGAQNVGREAVINYFVKTNDAAHKAKLKRMSELYPDEVKNIPENEGIGDMVIHLATTPYIEVAGDCKTAKGLWYVPSINVEIDQNGDPVPVTIWEKCDVDFIKEDGKWKIWHFTQWVQFAAPLNKSLVDGSFQLSRPFFSPQPLGGQEAGRQPAQQPVDMSQTKSKDQAYSTKRVADWRPGLPKPYNTWENLTSEVSK